MSSMTSLYRNFYTKFQASYGPDTCILLLVGKFYELYDYIDSTTNEPLTPIKRAAQIMNLTLKEKPSQGPSGELGLWSGFPEQSLHKFAYSLTTQGWTVVVVDQVKDATNHVIDRIPTRILSPGTHVENASQDRLSVAGLSFDNKYSAAVNDLTTGEVITFTTDHADDIVHMFQVYCVKEVVITGLTKEDAQARLGIRCSIHSAPPLTSFNTFAREEYVRKMFRVKSLLPVKTALSLEITDALILLLRFIEDHFPQQADRLITHIQYNPAKYMRLSNNILEQLNIITDSKKSVLSILDRTHSAIGKRALRERILRPVTSEEELVCRWNQIEFVNTLESARVKILERDIRGLYDLPRLHFKIASGNINESDILQIFQSYSATACLIENLRKTVLECPIETDILTFRKLFNSVFDEGKAHARTEGQPVGFLTNGAGPFTQHEEVKIESIQTSWTKKLDSFSSRLGVSSDLFTVVYDNDYFLEAPRQLLKTLNEFVSKDKGIQIESKKSGPIRVTFPDFEEYSAKLRYAVHRLNITLSKEILSACDLVWDSVKDIQERWIEWLGRIDCSLSLSAISKELKWCKPSLGNSLNIQELRHPILEAQQTRASYVKHGVSIAEGEGWLIYGVNASGKSSLMKATGIAVILAQAGSYVPASSMVIRPYDAAFSRIWNQDNIWAGLSSFAVEISELSDIIKLSTSKSLVLGDEVCSGTESESATSLVAATLEHLEQKGTNFMFATHLHDLLKVPGFQRPKISVWHLRVIRTPDNKLIYDRTLQPGSGSSSYGLDVAKAMGLPYELMTRAYEIRRSLAGSVSADKAPKSSWNTLIQRAECENCHSKFTPGLEVHHIEERAKGGNNHIRNLAVLCESCHDKHHSGELHIHPLTQTSDGLERADSVSQGSRGSQGSQGTEDKSYGLERFSYTPKQTNAKKELWTVEQMETIRATINEFKGRPNTRIASELQLKHGIIMTPAQLSRVKN